MYIQGRGEGVFFCLQIDKPIASPGGVIMRSEDKHWL